MNREHFILTLCREAGELGVEATVIEQWEADHACCCAFQVTRAAAGERQTVETIRRCMDLPRPQASMPGT
jgi:hypothetical protein